MDMKDVFMRLMYRNDELGLARFDPSDIETRFPFTWLYRRYPSRIAQLGVRLLKIPAILAPITYRRILGVSRYIYPTVYHHLGRAYWHALTWDPDYADQWRSRLKTMCEGALRDSIIYNGRRSWGAGSAHLAFGKIRSPETPCAHMASRVGSLLLLAGKIFEEQKYIEAAVESARVLCEDHNWHMKNKSQMTVSYFIDSEDEVINIGSDTAILLAELIAIGYDDSPFPEYLTGLTRMICAEQDHQGRWMYATRDFYEKTRSGGTADCHHSAQVISGLLRVLKTGVLENTLADEVQRAASQGLRYYIKTFFRSNGFAMNLEHRRFGEASIGGYGEGIVCMCEALESNYISTRFKADLDLENLVCSALQVAINRFVDFKTWDVASYRYGPLRVNIRSIRWGSAIMMEAISHFLAFQRRKIANAVAVQV